LAFPKNFSLSPAALWGPGEKLTTFLIRSLNFQGHFDDFRAHESCMQKR
jgi:hypothetical protein